MPGKYHFVSVTIGRALRARWLRIAHLEPQTLTIGKDTRVAALEFCVHGIVVHLRLGLFANTNGKITGI